MERQQAFDFLREVFPNNSFVLKDDLWFHKDSGDLMKPEYIVHVLDACKKNGEIAAGTGKTWNEAIKAMFKDLFKNDEA